MSDIRMFAPSVDRLVEDGQEIIDQNGEDTALSNTLEGKKMVKESAVKD